MSIESRITDLIRARHWRMEAIAAIRNKHPRKSPCKILSEDIFDWFNDRCQCSVTAYDYPADVSFCSRMSDLIKAILGDALQEYDWEAEAETHLQMIRYEIVDATAKKLDRVLVTEDDDAITSVFDGDIGREGWSAGALDVLDTASEILAAMR